MIELCAHVVRFLLLLAWKIFLAMRAKKIRPKMTQAATIIPTTTLGRPDLDEESDWLTPLIPVLAELDAVEVTVTKSGVETMGGDDVTTWAVVNGLVDVVVVLGVLVVVGVCGVGVTITGVGVSMTVCSTVLVLLVDVVGSSLPSPPPKITEKKEATGSSSPSCLRSSAAPPRLFSRAARASCRTGKYIVLDLRFMRL